MSERVKIILDKNADILRLPAIALRGLVVFPGNIIHFEVGRKVHRGHRMGHEQ
ncbi:MAG: hypothetical protein ACLRZH_13205 [Ruthenibacterium lactatiformans]